jgi:hypothetical protein
MPAERLSMRKVREVLRLDGSSRSRMRDRLPGARHLARGGLGMRGGLPRQDLTTVSGALFPCPKFGDKKGCQMPFSKHLMDPARIEAMRAAFRKVCDALMLRCDVEDPMMEVIVAKIVALAEAGEHDANRLSELVLYDIADDGLAAAE